MATAVKATVQAEKTTTYTAKQYTLTLDEFEAGFLYDLLHAHVAGELVTSANPLGRIKAALMTSGVLRLYALNANKAQNGFGSGYGKKYAVLNYMDEYDKEAYSVVPKFTNTSKVEAVF